MLFIEDLMLIQIVKDTTLFKVAIHIYCNGRLSLRASLQFTAYFDALELSGAKSGEFLYSR